MELDEWHRAIDVNFNSIYYCMHYQILLMVKSAGGSIVNILSMLGLIATKKRAAYVTSNKHTVTGVTKAAALYYADQQIQVNFVHPGYIEALLIAHINQIILAEKHTIGRLEKLEEVAALVKFLFSDESKFITGSQYVVEGGYSIQ